MAHGCKLSLPISGESQVASAHAHAASVRCAIHIVHRLLAWIEATIALLCILVSGGLAAYFYPIWAAHRRQVATDRLRVAEGTLDTAEELIAGSGSGTGGGSAETRSRSQSQRITGISGGTG